MRAVVLRAAGAARLSASPTVRLLLLALVAALAVAGGSTSTALVGAVGAVAVAAAAGAASATAARALAAAVLTPTALRRPPELAQPVPARQHDPGTAGRPMPRAPGAVLLPRPA